MHIRPGQQTDDGDVLINVGPMQTDATAAELVSLAHLQGCLFKIARLVELRIEEVFEPE